MPKTAQIKPDRRKPVSRKKAVADVNVSDEAVAARAFEYYLSRGGEHGRDMDDWLAAERDLRAPAAASGA